MEQYIIIGLSLVIIALLIVIISKSKGKDYTNEFTGLNNKLDNTNSNLSNGFVANRQEISGNLDKMGDKLSEMTKQNYEQQIKMTSSLVKTLNEIRDANTQNADNQSRKLDNSIKAMQESNEKKLEEMRITVDEKLTSTLTTRLDSSFKTVSEQLQNVYTSLGEMKELSGGVTANMQGLNRILTNVKARGTWAEVQLENILDQTIPNMFEKNFQPNPKSAARIEFAVKIPSGDSTDSVTYLPIDSKFPMEDYIKLTTAADNADQVALDEARKALENRVKAEAKKITQYVFLPVTTPFAIMYLATEGLYAEIMSSRTGIAEKIQSEFNVMIAGPTTITALLNSLAMGFRTIAINKKADEVWKVLGAAKGQYEKFGNLLERARKKVDEAGKVLDDAQDRNRIIQKSLRSVETLENESNEILGISEE